MTIHTSLAPRTRVFSVHNVGQFAARTGFEMPETLPATAAELETLLAAARAEVHVYEAQHDAGRDLSPEDVDALRSLIGEGGFVDQIEAAHQAAVAAEADHSAEVQGLLSRAAGQSQTPEGDSGQQDAPETDEGAEGAPEGGTAEGAPVEGAPAAEPVAASATPAAQRPQFTGRGVPDVIPGHEAGDTPASGWNMHPGAPGYREGMGTVGFGDIARSLDRIRPGSRASMRPNRSNKMMDGMEFARQVVSTLDRNVPTVDDPHALVAAINEATKASNLTRPTFDEQTGSLTAAGGWCAPSEQLYDFCDVPDATDLVSLPEITINRGGVRWPVEPDLSGIFEDFEWFFTEVELEATDPVTGLPTAVKQCVEVPCTDEFEEIRLNAVGWCVEAGILQVQGWPELVEWFMRNLTQEHLRALSRRTILDMVAGSSKITIPATSTMGAMASVLNSISLVATNLRLKRGLARTAVIEGVAPSWFHEVIRADIAMRAGGVEVFSVTDAQIDAALSARNIRLQYVGDWQTRGADLPGNLATTSWPDQVKVLMYPAGTWFRSMSNVIELGVMYPKEQLQINRFTRMFTEDAIAVGKRCGESVEVTMTLDVSGATGALQRRTNLAA